MKTGLLTSSSLFGKYVPNGAITQLLNDKVSAINLKQNFSHERPFAICRFDIPGNRLYLLDTSGTLIHLNLNDSSFSTFKGDKIQNFTIDGNNSLSILYVNHKSELYSVSFENKKPTKITNLSMNKLKSFQRNYLRDMLLALDYNLLFLCDITTRQSTNQLKIKSLKAKKDQIFTNACFASNNRFIILAVKNVQIRIIQIMDLKSVHQIKLPFVVSNLKIQVSYDSKKVAIYGDCNIIFFINFIQNQNYAYELIQIPFLKSLVQLKYTSQNDIVFLGNDQILYAVSPNEPDKAVPIFNQQFQIRTMNFDISLDCTKIALVSNRTVMQLKFPKGLRAQIQQKKSFKRMQFRKNGFEQYKSTVFDQPIIEVSQEQIEQPAQKKIQYEDQDGSQEQDQQKQQQAQDLINLDGLFRSKQLPEYKEQCGSLYAPVADLKGVDSQTKAKINSVLNNLLLYNKQIAKNSTHFIVNGLVKLIRDYKLNPEKSYQILDFVIRSVSKQKERFRHFGLILCPQIVAIIERKFHKNFIQFCQDQILYLYSNYFIGKQWKQALNWILSAGVNEKSQNLPLLLICILLEIYQIIHIRKKDQLQLLLYPEGLQIKFSEIYNKIVKIYLDSRYKNLFIKRKVADLVTEAKDYSAPGISVLSDNRLEQLIIKHDQIKKALTDMKRNKGTD